MFSSAGNLVRTRGAFRGRLDHNGELTRSGPKSWSGRGGRPQPHAWQSGLLSDTAPCKGAAADIPSFRRLWSLSLHSSRSDNCEHACGTRPRLRHCSQGPKRPLQEQVITSDNSLCLRVFSLVGKYPKRSKSTSTSEIPAGPKTHKSRGFAGSGPDLVVALDTLLQHRPCNSPCPPRLPQQWLLLPTHSLISLATRSKGATNLSVFSGPAPSVSCTRP